MDFERDNPPQEDWTEDLTQPEQPEPKGITEEELRDATPAEEEVEIEAPRPIQEAPTTRGFLMLLLNLIMLGFSIAIVYTYFMQDINSGVRNTLALAAGGLFIILFMVLLIAFYFHPPFKTGKAGEHRRMAHFGPSSGMKPVLDITVEQPFVQYRATPVKLTIRNISETEGIRVRFHSMDHVSPSSIDLPLQPQEEASINIQLVPIAVGEREISIEFADLFDAEGNLIPKFEANTLAVERFRYIAREPAFGGITASQVRTLKTVVSVATALIVGSGFLLAFFGEALGGFEQIIKTYMPMLVILQVPVFYIYFALMNRLPS